MNKISVIVTGRNDNYDGNFEERLALAMSRNIKNLPEAEFIFVEWNPYLDRPLCSENLKKIFKDRIRYFVVDPKYHEQYCTLDGFLEYPPKNVGIRKASNDFILCTNSDIIFSPQVINSMLHNNLRPNVVYRATRVDIPLGYKDVQFPLLGKYKLQINQGVTNAGGDFLLLHKNTWHWITGYCEEFPNQRIHKDAFIIHLLVNEHKMPWENLGYISHWRHQSSWSELYTNRPGIGDPNWDFRKSGFTKNKDTWGLTFTREEVRGGITWLV